MKRAVPGNSSRAAGGTRKTSIGRRATGLRGAVSRYRLGASAAARKKASLSRVTTVKPSEVTQLQNLLKRHDYTAMMEEVTPSFFQRGLRDAAARKSLRRLENELLREAKRLLKKRDYKAAAKLLDKIVRLGGRLRSSAQTLKKTAGAKAAGRVPAGKRTVKSAKKASRKNGGGRTPKPSRPKAAATKKPVKKAAKKAQKKAAKGPPTPYRPTPRPPKQAAGPVPLAKKEETFEYRAGKDKPYVGEIPDDEEYEEEEEEEEEPESVLIVEEEVDMAAETVGGSKGNGGDGGGGTGFQRATSEGGGRRMAEGKKQTEVLRRTPHMDLSPGEYPLVPGTEFEVYVSVDAHAARPGEETQDLELEGLPSQQEFPVEVTLVVSGHFEPPEDDIRTMTILRKGDTSPVVFKLRCAKQFPPEKDGALSALFKYEGHPSGRVTRRFKVEKDKLVFATSDVAAEAGVAAAPAPIASKPKLTAVSGLDQYDMTISVIDTGENDYKHFRLIVDSPAFGKYPIDVPWILGDRTDQIVRNYMAKFVASNLNTTKRLAELKGAGVQLFESTPKTFQLLFWDLIDSGRAPKTIMVISDEPYMPWELMVPRRMVGGKLEDRSPLGVEFCVGRWIRSDYTSAPQQILLDKTYVVAPKYVIANKNLKFAPAEAAFVCANFQPSEQINPADIDPINNALRDKGATLLHFVCHGSASSGTDQTILLQDMVNNLSSSTVDGLDGFVIGFPRDHTFVFLNACEVGRSAPALVGVGGFASTFLKLGASGVVAALWSVEDELAYQVALTFYKRMLKEPDTPFAEILRDIRALAYSGNSKDTYAAYCFYGSPLAKRKMSHALH